jgi:periplasmic protein TonB
MTTAPQPSASPNARFLAGAVPRGTDERVRFGHSIMGSACTHVGGFLLAVFIIGNRSVTPPSTDPVDDKPPGIVWLNVPGPGSRGGSDGDGKPEPPRKAERSKRDTIPLSVATPPTLAREPLKDVPKPDTEIDIPAVNTSPSVVDMPGALTGLPTVPSQGGALGRGTGMGTGTRGAGFGTGDDGGTGNGPFGPGNGVTMPRVLTEVKPSYTAEAMRAKVQGAVMVEAIVREDGRVGQVRIVRSLDRTFGLDEEALKAVKNWRFSPGKRQGQNVAVLVEIELTFTLR